VLPLGLALFRERGHALGLILSCPAAHEALVLVFDRLVERRKLTVGEDSVLDLRITGSDLVAIVAAIA